MRLILTSILLSTLFFACSDDDDDTASGSSSGGSGVAVGFPLEGVLSVGANHTCLAETDGTVLCWGQQENGRLGNNASSISAQAGPTQVLSVGDGAGLNGTAPVTHAAATMPGRTGGHTYNPQNDLFFALEGITQVDAGETHTCGLGFDSVLHCWGNNENGQVGRLRLYPSGNNPSIIPVTETFDVATHVFQIGVRSTTAGTLTPFVPAEPFYRVTQVSAGGDHTCAVYDDDDNDGVVACWGLGINGQLEVDSLTPADSSADTPQPVALSSAVNDEVLSGIVQVASGGEHSCARSENGEVYCWGQRLSGQLGVGPGHASVLTPVGTTSTDAPLPVANVSGDSSGGNLGMITQVVAGDNHTCALSTAGSVYCWGLNQHGQLGVGDDSSNDTRRHGYWAVGGFYTNASADTPLQVSSTSGSGNLSSIVQLAAGANHTCALSNSRRVYCWGLGSNRQLGSGSRVWIDVNNVAANVSSDTPLAVVDVSGDDGQGENGVLRNVISISAGGNNTCALQASGRVVCWGNNGASQLGLGASASSLIPASVPDASSSTPFTVRASAYASDPYEYDFN